MLYKEWILVRQKFILLVVFYGLAALSIATIFAPNYNNQYPEAPFSTWLSVAQALTIGAAVLGGADTFANETDKGTMGFLLSHPISRTKVFLTKFALNFSILVVTLVAGSVAMFFVDRVPRNHAVYAYTFNDCGFASGDITSEAANPTTSLGVALTGLGITLVIGLTLLCVSTLISIYAHTTINAIMFTLLTILVLIAGLFFLNNTFVHRSIDFATFQSFQLLPYFIFVMVIFFLGGLFSFKRKEF